MITVVTGLPRSGTSLMMQILKAGGMEILTDEIRRPDISNPLGYFEYEKVKSLHKDSSWIKEAEGKAVKVIVQLVAYLPESFNYSVIIMKRNLDEIIVSQNKMIETLGGKKSVVGNDILKKTFELQFNKAKEYLLVNSNFKTFMISYNELLLGNLNKLREMNNYLNLNLNLEKVNGIIDQSLYRERITS